MVDQCDVTSDASNCNLTVRCVGVPSSAVHLMCDSSPGSYLAYVATQVSTTGHSAVTKH